MTAGNQQEAHRRRASSMPWMSWHPRRRDSALGTDGMSSHFTVVYDACVLYPAPLPASGLPGRRSALIGGLRFSVAIFGSGSLR